MHIHLLGYSEAVISRILDTLSILKHEDEVVIVQNMELPAKIPYDSPGIRTSKFFWDQWSFDPAKHICLPALANPAAKRKVVDFFKDNCGVQCDHYFTLCHPSSVVAETAKLGKGCYIEPGTVIASYAEIGFGVYVNRGSTVGHHVMIEDFVNLGPATHVAGHSHLGAGVQLGIGAVVFDHINIGAGSIIGGGSVVTKDIPPGVIAWGNPCKVIKNIPGP